MAVADGLRRPRYRLLLDGAVIDGCESLEFSTNNLSQAGCFFSHIACPDDGWTATRVSNVTGDTEISLRMGFLEPGMVETDIAWQEMMSGRLDRVRFDPVAGVVTLEGRDHTARLLDLPLSEGFLNATSSEVAALLAQRCGLGCIADPTQQLVGQYYQIDHARLALSRFSRYGTAWDLLCSLAQIESFEVWVSGSTLNFRNLAAASGQVFSVVYVPPQPGVAAATLNVGALTLERVAALAGGSMTRVSSWNSRQRLRVSAQSAGVPGSTTQTIEVIRPNLLQSSAQTLADGMNIQMSGHARTLSLAMPGDLTLGPRDIVRVSGVGRSWDGDYRIDRVDREASLRSGFSQRIEAKTLT